MFVVPPSGDTVTYLGRLGDVLSADGGAPAPAEASEHVGGPVADKPRWKRVIVQLYCHQQDEPGGHWARHMAGPSGHPRLVARLMALPVVLVRICVTFRARRLGARRWSSSTWSRAWRRRWQFSFSWTSRETSPLHAFVDKLPVVRAPPLYSLSLRTILALEYPTSSTPGDVLYGQQASPGHLTLLMRGSSLDVRISHYLHSFKAGKLTQFAASNEEKIYLLMKNGHLSN